MHIGKEFRTIQVEPLDLPERLRQDRPKRENPEVAPEKVPEKEREKELVGAGR